MVPFCQFQLYLTYKMVEPGFVPSDTLQQEALTSCIISVQKNQWQLLSCCSVCTCQHSYHSASRRLETTNLLNNSSTLPLLKYGVKHNSSAVIPQSLKINATTRYHVVRHYRHADANTLQCVTKVWSSCFQLLNQSSNSIHICTCMYFLQMSVNVKLPSHISATKNSITICVTQTSIYAILESTVTLPYVEFRVATGEK